MTLRGIAYSGTQFFSDILKTVGPYSLGGIGAGVKYSVYRGYTGTHRDVLGDPMRLLNIFLGAQLFNMGVYGVGEGIEKAGEKLFGPVPTKLQKLANFASKNAILATLAGGVSSVYAYNKIADFMKSEEEKKKAL